MSYQSVQRYRWQVGCTATNANQPCATCPDFANCPLICKRMEQLARERPVTELLKMSSEGLIILVRDGQLALYNKFKSQGGVLHKYLAIMLEELLQKVQDDAPTANPD